MVIEPFDPARIEDVVELSLRAWEPVFTSLEDIMEPAVFRHFYPNWRTAQAEAVRAACRALDAWVAREGPRVAGFTTLDVDPEEGVGEIHMIAVDPDFQGRGIGLKLTEHALERFEALGLSVAVVETGGDAGHAPARGLYERAGFRLLPVARYFRAV